MTTWSEDHVTLWAMSSSVKFGGNRLWGIPDIKLLNCHVTSHDCTVRGSYDIVP